MSDTIVGGKMTIQELKKALPHLLKHNIPPFLWGNQGIGKTETIVQYAKEQNLGIVLLNLATQDPGDLIGLLIKNPDGITVKHARPSWFPTDGKGIIFLDEFNRAHTDVHQAMFPFILSGRMHEHQLPEGWRVVAAGNYESDSFNVTSIQGERALMSRFCHVDVKPSLEEWLVYAENKGLFDVADFIREQQTMLEPSDKSHKNGFDASFILPNRRAWVGSVGKLDLDPNFPEELKYEVYSGLVGSAAAAAFITQRNKKDKNLTLNQVLSKYGGKVRDRVMELGASKKDKRFDLLNQPIDELFAKLDQNPELLATEHFLGNLKNFLLDIPRELSMKAFVKMTSIKQFYGRHDLINDPEYVRLFND